MLLTCTIAELQGPESHGQLDSHYSIGLINTALFLIVLRLHKLFSQSLVQDLEKPLAIILKEGNTVKHKKISNIFRTIYKNEFTNNANPSRTGGQIEGFC